MRQDVLDPAELRTFIRAMCAAAWSDRMIQDEERDALSGFIDAADLDQAQHDEALAWLNSPVPIDDVDWAALRPEVRAYVYLSAVRIVKADGKVESSESAFLREIAERMELEPALVERVHTSDALE